MKTYLYFSLNLVYALSYRGIPLAPPLLRCPVAAEVGGGRAGDQGGEGESREQGRRREESRGSKKSEEEREEGEEIKNSEVWDPRSGG